MEALRWRVWGCGGGVVWLVRVWVVDDGCVSFLRTSTGDVLAIEEFLVGCRRYPHWFQQYVGDLENGKLQNDLQGFWSSEAGGNSYVEIPRGHTKTVSLAYRLAWEIGNDPLIRVKYVGSNEVESAKTVTMVRRILESDLFSHVFPELEADKDNWGNQSFTVKRSRSLRDPTLDGVSVLGRAGGRADLLVFDDICDLRNAVMQPSAREQVKEFVKNNWLPMRDRSNKTRPPRTWRIGTPYHVADITADWRGYHERTGSLFRRPVVDFVSPWPERYTSRDLREVREEMGAIAYARAYELVPVSSDQLVFPGEWLERSMWLEMSDHVRLTGTRIATVDFAFSKKTEEKKQPDYSVLLVGTRALDGSVWLERMWRVRSSWPEFLRLVRKECTAMQVWGIWAEQSGPQRGLVQQMQLELGIPVVGVERSKDKHTRAAEKQPFVESGRFRIRASAENPRAPHEEFSSLFTELATFPAGEHDDTVDAAMDMIDAAEGSSCGSHHVPGTVSGGRNRLWRLGYAG